MHVGDEAELMEDVFQQVQQTLGLVGGVHLIGGTAKTLGSLLL